MQKIASYLGHILCALIAISAVCGNEFYSHIDNVCKIQTFHAVPLEVTPAQKKKNSSESIKFSEPKMAKIVREGTTIIVNATQKQTGSIIFTHGLGDSADGWKDAVVEMSRYLPHIKWILPTAPNNPVTLNGGMRMPSWYDIESLSKSRTQQQCRGLDESKNTIMSLIEKEKTSGIHVSRIVVAGFSQGGALSLWTGLQFPSTQPEHLAGVLVLSGYLPKGHAFSLSSHGMKTPVLHCHGTADPVVIPDFATDSKSHIVSAGHTAGYELKMYPGMAHSAQMQELMDVVAWLSKILPAL